MLVKLKKKIRRFILFSILKRKNYDLKDSIIICSEPRGGSTWLAEILGSLPRTVINLEPLHAYQGVVPPEFQFGWNPRINPEDDDEKFIQLFRDILSFKVYNRWTTGFVSLKKLIRSERLVTKFVLANQLLPWISAHLSPELGRKPIFLIRHPLTTCISQLRTFHNTNFEEMFDIIQVNERFEEPDTINNERFNRNKKYINSLSSKIERQVALWCINNAEIIKCPKNRWVSIFYEDLVRNPFKEIKNLMQVLEIPVEENFWRKVNFAKPSSSNFNNTYSRNQWEQLTKTFEVIPIENLQKIQDIFNYFEFTTYSAFEPFPKRGPKAVFLKK